jgi:hypothetical protein
VSSPCNSSIFRTRQQQSKYLPQLSFWESRLCVMSSGGDMTDGISAPSKQDHGTLMRREVMCVCISWNISCLALINIWEVHPSTSGGQHVLVTLKSQHLPYIVFRHIDDYSPNFISAFDWRKSCIITLKGGSKYAANNSMYIPHPLEINEPQSNLMRSLAMSAAP